MTDDAWQQILRIMDEAFGDYLTGMARLRERVVADLKRTLTDSKVLDRFDLEQSGPRGQPAAAARGPRVRGRRKRRS
jgi:hypothetical protein